MIVEWYIVYIMNIVLYCIEYFIVNVHTLELDLSSPSADFYTKVGILLVSKEAF